MTSAYFIGVSGTRHGANDRQLEIFTNFLKEIKRWRSSQKLYLVHGRCVGFDQQAEDIGETFGIKSQCYPSNWESTQSKVSKAEILAKPGPPTQRNSDIISRSLELIAAPAGDEESRLSRGTWDAINKAKVAKILVRIIMPCGTIIASKIEV